MLRQSVAMAVVVVLSVAHATGCETVTAQQLADALSKAPGLQSGLQSCAMAAMGMISPAGATPAPTMTAASAFFSSTSAEAALISATRTVSPIRTLTFRPRSMAGSRPRTRTRKAGATRRC